MGKQGMLLIWEVDVSVVYSITLSGILLNEDTAILCLFAAFQSRNIHASIATWKLFFKKMNNTGKRIIFHLDLFAIVFSLRTKLSFSLLSWIIPRTLSKQDFKKISISRYWLLSMFPVLLCHVCHVLASVARSSS